MSDILEVVISDDSLELIFGGDEQLEMIFPEENLELVVQDLGDTAVLLIEDESIELLTIAEQGPPGPPGSGGSGGGGFLGMHVGNTPPSTPAVGDLWLDTN